MCSVPQELNWVEARSVCSLERVFRELQLGAQYDVEQANKVMKESTESNASFDIADFPSGRSFMVFRGGGQNGTVKFHLANDQIVVAGPGETFSITLTLDNEGRCKLRVDGGDGLEQWQVRCMILEDLFFGPL